MTGKNWVQRLLAWLDPTPTVQMEAEEENIVYDRQKVDEEFRETIKSLRKARKTADALILIGELYVKDFAGELHGQKIPSRTKKPK